MESTEIIRQISKKVDILDAPADFSDQSLDFEDNLEDLGLIEPDSLEVENNRNFRKADIEGSILLLPAPDFCDEYDSDDIDNSPKKKLIVPVIVFSQEETSENSVGDLREVQNEETVKDNFDNEALIETVVHTSTLSFQFEETSLVRSPKKLFEEQTESEDTPDVNLKDLETKKLRELERERRRIIDNQVVRRKKIDYWAFANTNPPEFTEDQLLMMADENGGVEALVNVEDGKRDSSFPLPSPPPTPPPPIPGSKEIIISETISENISDKVSIEENSDSKDSDNLVNDNKENSESNDTLEFSIIEKVVLNDADDILLNDEDNSENNRNENLLVENSVEEIPIAKVEEFDIPLIGETEDVKEDIIAIIENENTKEEDISILKDSTNGVSVSESLDLSQSFSEANIEIENSEISLENLIQNFDSSDNSLEKDVPEMCARDEILDATEIHLPEDGDEEEPVENEDNSAYREYLQGICDADLPSIGTVDCESILENKERLRVFWENRIMADQEVIETTILDSELKDINGENIVTVAPIVEDLFKEVTQALEATPPDSLNESCKEPVIEPIEECTEVAKVLSVDEGEEMDIFEESALDREVRLALEREEQMKMEIAGRQVEVVGTPNEEKEEDFPVHHVALAPTVEVESEEEREEAKPEDLRGEVVETIEFKDEQTVKVIENLTETMVIETKIDKEILIENLSISDKAFAEDFIEIKDVLLSKPQIVGETYRHQEKVEEVIVEIQSETRGIISTSTTVPEFPKQARVPFNPNSDTKIAMEIKEMKEREEELKKMREVILKENQTNVSKSKSSTGSVSSRQSEQGSVHSEEDQLDRCINGEFKIQNGHSVITSPVLTPISTPNISLDSLHSGQNYNIGYAFGHRRKDGVKVKPLADEAEDEDDKQLPAFKVTVESPIEKEIRLAKEREEELKRDKVLSPQPISAVIVNGKNQEVAKQRPQTLEIQTNGKLSTSKTTPFQLPLKSGTINGTGDTQRFLATSRIQQEIEEQTEREKALRASGKIQTISQERTDAKVAGTRLRELNGISPESSVHTPLSPSPSLTDSEKSSTSPVFNGNGMSNGSPNKTPSPTNSTVSVGVKTTNGLAGRRFSNPPNGRNISMQRFIASKGKEVVSTFSNFNSSSKEKSHSILSLHQLNGGPGDFYQELKPPKVPKDLLGPTQRASPKTNGAVVGKRSLSAENKIQEELKEMQAREDELRQQRARLLGLSQPNLSLLDDEDIQDGLMTNGHDLLNHKQLINGTTLERANSNPNLLDEDIEFVVKDKKKNVSIGGPRRRSMLIDQWEKRIQCLETTKAS